jgi:hypothetical protein
MHIRQETLDGICIRMNSVGTHSFSNNCHNMEVYRSENSAQIGEENDNVTTVLL